METVQEKIGAIFNCLVGTYNFCLLDGDRIEVALCVKSQSYFFYEQNLS